MENTKLFLLTGAGFTHNFGAPLAPQMWAMIFNHPLIQKQVRVRELLLQNLDFEDVYQNIIDGPYSEEDKQAISNAILGVFSTIDVGIRQCFIEPEDSDVGIHRLREFIGRFTGHEKRPGFFFTLNQDLFVERHYLNRPRQPKHGSQNLFIPGVQGDLEWFTKGFTAPLDRAHLYELPDRASLHPTKDSAERLDRFNYIKLHGSSNWTSKLRPRQIVVGRKKTDQIQSEPLLEWYFNLFKGALTTAQSQLVVVGYGFGDSHINKVIADGISKHGLRMYVLSPSPPSAFRADLDAKPRGPELWKGLGGYYQCTFQTLFPAGQDGYSQMHSKIIDEIFWPEDVTWDADD